MTIKPHERRILLPKKIYSSTPTICWAIKLFLIAELWIPSSVIMMTFAITPSLVLDGFGWALRAVYSYFEEGCRKKMCTRQSRKVIWDTINSLFLTLYLLNLLLLLSFSTRKHKSMASPAILSKFLWRTVNPKPPTIPFGIVACTFSEDILILMYKVKNSLTPEHVCNMFFQQDKHYNLQSDFPVSRYDTVKYGKHSIRYLGPHIWGKISQELRSKTSLQAFRRGVRALNVLGLLDGTCGCCACSS